MVSDWAHHFSFEFLTAISSFLPVFLCPSVAWLHTFKGGKNVKFFKSKYFGEKQRRWKIFMSNSTIYITHTFLVVTFSRSMWSCSLRCRSTVARFLGSRFRIPLEAWTFSLYCVGEGLLWWTEVFFLSISIARFHITVAKFRLLFPEVQSGAELWTFLHFKSFARSSYCYVSVTASCPLHFVPSSFQDFL